MASFAARSQVHRRMPSAETSELLPAADVEIQRSPFALPGASLTFKDLGFSVALPDGTAKTILEPCSGHLEPGQLVALMGPSGCGKSTLLDMLAMKKTAAYTGEVLVNGHPRDQQLFRRIVAYVPQEDVMPAHWRVREAIAFNSALKSQGGPEASAMIDILIEAFGLGAVADTYFGGPKVRGISGGQRRRVTLARGVAAKTPLLFCDEPTSGLSATDAELCVKALRIIAKKLNVLVVVVIHQPRVEVASLFDTLVMLTSNPGRMAYFGPVSRAVPYLKTCGHEVPVHANPTDFFLDRLTPGTQTDASAQLVHAFQQKQKPALDERVMRACLEKGETAEEMLRSAEVQAARAQLELHPLRDAMGANAHHEAASKGAAPTGQYSASFATQLRQLLRRKVAITLRNPVAIVVSLALPAVQGLVVGAMFQGIGQKDLQEQFPFLFILLTVLCLAGLGTMPIIIDERTVMKYETSEALYSEAAAAMTSFCVDVPLALAGSAVSVLITYALSGLPFEYLPTFFLWSMLLFSVFDSFFAFVAAAAVDAQQAQAVAGPFVSIFMLFNGFIITRSTAPSFLRWIFWISPNAYAFQAIAARMAEDMGPAGQFVLQLYDLSADHNALGITFMIGASVAFRALQLVALRLCHNIQK